MLGDKEGRRKIVIQVLMSIILKGVIQFIIMKDVILLLCLHR